jgi:Zn-dependent protease
MPLAPSPNCTRCGALLPPTALVCPACGTFVHAQQLSQISAQALQLEPIDPRQAAAVWSQTLELIPPNSPQYQMVTERMAKLAVGIRPAGPLPGSALQRRRSGNDSLSLALLKTFGSMLLSIVVYAALLQNVILAAALVVLILVHEMGHVIANRYYGIKASPPIFIPFVGAVINLRQQPPNAKVEAVIGIGGPIAGTIASFAAYLIYLHTGSQLALVAAHFGFLINLFNMLPVPPLDGGRVTAAVSPWIWMLGVAGLLYFLVEAILHRAWWNVFILAMIGRFAYPRILATLRSKGQDSEYYKISRLASWTIAFLYVALGLTLLYFVVETDVSLP